MKEEDKDDEWQKRSEEQIAWRPRFRPPQMISFKTSWSARQNREATSARVRILAGERERTFLTVGSSSPRRYAISVHSNGVVSGAMRIPFSASRIQRASFWESSRARISWIPRARRA
jgi:hypothetical protein